MRRTASYVHRVFSNYQTTRPCASGAFGSCDARGKTARVVNPPTRHHPRVGALISNREKLGMEHQVFVVWTSKSGLNQPTVV